MTNPGVRFAIAGVLLAALPSCGEAPGTAPGAVSEGEARALEEAAEMLDERRLPEGALPETGAPEEAAGEGSEMTGDSAG